MRARLYAALALSFALATEGCAAGGSRGGAYVMSTQGVVFSGTASWYSDSLTGRPTASGALYDPWAFTAAHRNLPFGTRLRVERADTGQSVEVVVNDRGPFGNLERVIDLSRAAATQLQMLRSGLAPVRVTVLEVGHGRRRRP